MIASIYLYFKSTWPLKQKKKKTNKHTCSVPRE